MTTPIARAMFGRLFDNAAMYPPAQAPMEASIALHDAAERAPWGFARGRFLCPGARLEDLATELRLLGRDRKALQVGAVIGSPADVNERPPVDEVVAAIGRLRESTPAVHVDLFEVRPPSQDPDRLGSATDEVAAAAEASGADTVFLEVAVAGASLAEITDRVAAVAEARERQGLRVGAKVRCGGLQPGMVPTLPQLATFLVATRAHGLPFKATAGLHHAFTSTRGDDGTVDHVGFVSLLLASLATGAGDLDAAAVDDLLARTDTTGLELADERLVVPVDGKDSLDLDAEAITAARYRGFVAFGTCSFTEPAHDAQRLIGTTS